MLMNPDLNPPRHSSEPSILECNKDDSVLSSTPNKYLKPSQKQRRPLIKEAFYLSGSGASTTSKISNISEEYEDLKKKQLLIHRRIAVALEKIAGISNESTACSNYQQVNEVADEDVDNYDNFNDKKVFYADYEQINESADDDVYNYDKFDNQAVVDTNYQQIIPATD
ncbi:hypothetical protein HCN44_009927 [Aphidius gifuensis]|uniref:Uncharacterized protein n=1 Tax=Aphidius gifuensis TaxID=684658 RepID=A0A834Y415_APHGI|nr:hypothetical protein HCN44_009927 [Aphidius gifuensis]